MASMEADDRYELVIQDEESLDQGSHVSPKSSLRALGVEQGRPGLKNASFEWTLGFWERLPLTSLLAIIVVLCCAGACFVVLWFSDGRNVETWSYVRPAVLLAILSASSNASLRYALFEGLQTAWWVRAIKPQKVKKLHTNWKYGTSLLSAASGILRGDLIAIATMAVTIVVVNGPLLQRASSTNLAKSNPAMVPVNITIATHLPFGYSGMDFQVDGEGLAGRLLITLWSADAIFDYSRGKAISTVSATGCEGLCERIVEAAGLWKACTETQETLESVGINTHFELLGRQIFAVDWEFVTQPRHAPSYSLSTYGMSAVQSGMNETIPTDEPYISLNITWSPPPNTGSATRVLYTRSCRLYSATSRYPVRISNDIQDVNVVSAYNLTSNFIRLTGPAEPIEGSVQNVRKAAASTGLPLRIDPAWIQEGDDSDQTLYVTWPVPYFQSEEVTRKCGFRTCPFLMTLGGVSSAAEDLLMANVTALDIVGHVLLTKVSGSLSNQFIQYSDEIYSGASDVFAYHKGWTDPTSFIFGVLDEVMFRMAINSASMNTLQNVSFAYVGESAMTPVPNRNTSSQFKIFPQPQIVLMRQTRTIQIYESLYWFLWGAIAAMILGVGTTMILFHGFWSLGRTTSLSPLETAKAFKAPALDAANSNADADQLVRITGAQVLRYGEVRTRESSLCSPA